MEKYLIHDNGGRPFKVEIDKNIRIYKEIEYNKYSEKNILNFKKFNKIFIGKSPKNSMTTFSNGYGYNFDGNSILIHIQNNEYVYIGKEIFRFYSFADIISYNSPVGNNDVPYPYAIDKENNYYLLIEDLVINKKSNDFDDPYEYYYNNINNNIMPDNINGEKIKDFMIGNQKYNFTYYPRPYKGYDRISKWEDFGEGMYFLLENDKKHKLSRKEYIKIMKKIGRDKNLKYLKGYKLLQKRLW